MQGEAQEGWTCSANELFLRVTNGTATLAGMVSEEMAGALPDPGAAFHAASTCWSSIRSTALEHRRERLGRHHLFGAARARLGADPRRADFLQPGPRKWRAGYAIYGPTTMLVLTVGNGVVGFTLDPTSASSS